MKLIITAFVLMSCHLTDSICQEAGKPGEEKTDSTSYDLEEIVVTASLYEEKVTRAPASVQVLTARDFSRFAGSNPGELVAMIQGIEYTRYGVDGITFNARGINSAFNNKVLQIVDGRISTAALSGNLPVFNNGTTVKDDIRRLEIVPGPQTSLFGPNAHNAVFYTTTLDPRLYPGTSISVSTGNPRQLSGRFRHAQALNDKWAYKVTFEDARGRDFTFYDSVAIAGIVMDSVPELNVDFNFSHRRGEAHAYYSFAPGTDIILSGGNSVNHFLQTHTGARNRMQGFAYSFLQARLVHPRFYVNVYNTWGNIGTSYNIGRYTSAYWSRWKAGFNPEEAERLALAGPHFKEKSQRLNAEAQYRAHLDKAGLFFVAALNFQNERPNGFGVNLIDSFERISIFQYGGALYAEKALPLDMRLIGAVRLDHHNGFGTFLAPKLGLVKNIGNSHIRLSWARAYAMPTILHQFAGINRSLFGNGGSGITYIPNGSSFSDPASVRTTTPLKVEEVSTWELGFKGCIGSRLFLDVNVYNGLSNNFITPEINVHGRALEVNGIKVTHNPTPPATAGTVVNDTLHNARFSTYFNYGKVNAYGLDAGATWAFSPNISLAVKYSWFGAVFHENDANRDGMISPDEKSLNAPQNRVMAALTIQNLLKDRLFVNLGARFVEAYEFFSGSQRSSFSGKGKWRDRGPLGGFTTFNLHTGYQLTTAVWLNLGITNMLNTRQQEFPGSPSISRLIMAEVKVNIE